MSEYQGDTGPEPDPPPRHGSLYRQNRAAIARRRLIATAVLGIPPACIGQHLVAYRLATAVCLDAVYHRLELVAGVNGEHLAHVVRRPVGRMRLVWIALDYTRNWWVRIPTWVRCYYHTDDGVLRAPALGRCNWFSMSRPSVKLTSLQRGSHHGA